MKFAALVPVKSLDQAKSRLSHHLTQEQRGTLVLEMLQHVLCTLHSSQAFDHISVVSADHSVLERVRTWGAQGLAEEQAGHNPALTAAAARELLLGTTALLTISADLPLLQANDIHALLEQSEQHDVVLAAAQNDTGTNALLVRPPLALPYVFGPDSLRRYQREAEQSQLSISVYRSLGLELDIDTIEDIELLQTYEREHAISAACR